MSCPICDKPAVEKYRPFCSKRCADIDLGRWFDGTYTLADDSDSPETDAATETDSNGDTKLN